jgi:Flp pilus assembly protein TadG
MSSWLKTLNRFRSNERGNIAMLFGLSLIPVAGAAGVAVDYSSASNLRTALQAEVDATALEIATIAVDVRTDPANAAKSYNEKEAIVDARIATIMVGRRAMAKSRKLVNQDAFQMSGAWVDAARNNFRVTAGSDVKKYVTVLNSNPVVPVSVAATARLESTSVLKTPEMISPGYDAGDYNRLIAYCYSKTEPDASKRRTQMTSVTSNGESGGQEIKTAEVFKNVSIPSCDTARGETLSWRLLNIRGARTTKSKWPTDTKGTQTKTVYANGAVKWSTVYVDGQTTEIVQYGSATGPVVTSETKTTTVWRINEPTSVNQTSTDPKVRGLYNHYSDTTVNEAGVESFSFTGHQMGYNAPINIMETQVCDTKDRCNPYKPGSDVAFGKNRTPGKASVGCSPGKFMYIGFEDRPYIPGRPAGEYNDWNSGYWTDRDYEDVTFVMSCPEYEYTRKVRLVY